ncbi:cupin domain-containing protein [Arthrobacter sp. GCM10027362]|uniref:cupin domain-containing protein n=1 Tax=Arthrobacter sp. GCM10027362 TaxID=3273379 RepID=UPI00362C48A1
MLERAGAHAFRYNLHEGSPLQMQWLFYGQSELPVAVQAWELPPGGFEGMHSHAEPDRPLEEIYVVTAGTGQMTVDGHVYPVSAGDAVLARVGTEHDLRNTGDEPLKVLVIWGEPGSADYSSFGSAKRALAARTEADEATDGHRTSQVASASSASSRRGPDIV